MDFRAERGGSDRFAAASPINCLAGVASNCYVSQLAAIGNVEMELGHLTLEVRAQHGPRRFTMRWSQSQAQDFGERGKVLLDLDENRYLVPDVEALRPKEQELFLRYLDW